MIFALLLLGCVAVEFPTVDDQFHDRLSLIDTSMEFERSDQSLTAYVFRYDCDSSGYDEPRFDENVWVLNVIIGFIDAEYGTYGEEGRGHSYYETYPGSDYDYRVGVNPRCYIGEEITDYADIIYIGSPE